MSARRPARALLVASLTVLGCVEAPGAPKSDDTAPADATGPAFLAGRDYWPADVRAHGYRVLDFGESLHANAADVVFDDGAAWVLLGGLRVAPLDLETGLIDYAASTETVLPGYAEDAADRDMIANAAVRRCAPRRSDDVALTYDADTGRWRAPTIGIDPDSVVFREGCALGPGGFVPGTLDARGTRTYDSFDVVGCDAPTASYAWTTCSLAGDEAWRCPVDLDGDPRTVTYGACSWFLLYEGNVVLAERSETLPTQYDLRLFLAHGASLHERFRKYTADDTENPTLADARIASTAPNAENVIPGSSWASVPSLYRDEAAGLWRAYFSTAVFEGPAQRYAESADDGLTWGVDGHAAPSIDCWDAATETFDETACRAVTWADGAAPADDPDTPRDPDVVDGQVIPWPGPEAEDGAALLLFSGADPRCAPSPRWSGYGAAFHPSGGDMSVAPWEYVDAVPADPEHGTLVSPDRSDGTCADLLHDFTVTQVAEGRYVMLYQPVWRLGLPAEESDGTYLSASGFACSNFADDDGDGAADYGVDPDCSSPLDESE